MTDERRKYQRLHLTKPVDGWFGEYPVRLLDVSALGARIETDEEIPIGARGLLRFFWRDRQLEIMAETIRTETDLAGLRFLDDSESLRELLATSATDLLRAQEANLRGDRARNILRDDETLTAASAGAAMLGYLQFSLENGVWIRRRVFIPEQPSEGFTVAASEPAEQIEMLCKTYEAGDAETRRMTRLFAELSVGKGKENA